MNAIELTSRGLPTKPTDMQGERMSVGISCLKAAILVAGLSLTAGCINVNAPSEPIVIELNINITQEVIYRLAADAGNTIDENADIF